MVSGQWIQQVCIHAGFDEYRHERGRCDLPARSSCRADRLGAGEDSSQPISDVRFAGVHTLQARVREKKRVSGHDGGGQVME